MDITDWIYIGFCLLALAICIWGVVLSGDDVKLSEFIVMMILSFVPVINVLMLLLGIMMIFERAENVVLFKGRK